MRPVTRTIASSAAAPMMSESRGMIVIPLDWRQELRRLFLPRDLRIDTPVGKNFHGLCASNPGA